VSLYNSRPSVRDALAIVCYEFDVLDGTVVMPWIMEEVAGAVCGMDCI